MVYKNLLHSFNMAHLDIRVDNICVNSNSDLVFIDLDRSVNNPERKAYNFNHMYQNKQYSVEVGWNFRQVDWLQVGYLLMALFPRLIADPFLLKLQNEGAIKFRSL